MENPFTKEYLQQERDFYTLKSSCKKGSASLNVEDSGYYLLIDQKLWMSLSYDSEIVSTFLPLHYSKGDIATAGLGLGYYTLRAAAKEEVKSIDVFEINQDVIDLFIENFSDTENFEKITIIKGDVRETFNDSKDYDFVFLDIYLQWFTEEAIQDFAHFSKYGNIKHLYVWTQDAVLMDAYRKNFIEGLTGEELALFEMFKDFKLPSSIKFLPVPSKEYSERFLKAACRLAA